MSPPGGLELGICPRIQSKNGKFPSHYKLAQSILKHKFPSVHKPLQKYASQKRPLKNNKPRGLLNFWNFMVTQWCLDKLACFALEQMC